MKIILTSIFSNYNKNMDNKGLFKTEYFEILKLKTHFSLQVLVNIKASTKQTYVL